MNLYEEVHPNRVWPDHPGHEIVFSIHGRTDHRRSRSSVKPALLA